MQKVSGLYRIRLFKGKPLLTQTHQRTLTHTDLHGKHTDSSYVSILNPIAITIAIAILKLTKI